MNRLGVFAAFAALVLAAPPALGAENSFAKFYVEGRYRTILFTAATAPAKLLSDADSRDDVVMDMWARGFGVFATSEFNGVPQNPSDAIAVANKVGASFVYIDSKYTDTAVADFVTPDNSTTVYSGWGQIDGDGRHSSATDTFMGAATTSHGFRTEHLTRKRYDIEALYFAPMVRMGFGIRVRLLRREEVQRVETYDGLMVTSVWRDSPAFRAHLLPGDIVLSVNGRPVHDADSFQLAYESMIGKTAPVKLFRSGRIVVTAATVASDERF